MTAQPVAWSLYEPDGTLLARGLGHELPEHGASAAVLTVIEQPGRLVQRCLLGDLRRVWVHAPGQAPRPAQVERVHFDPRHGRICALHFEPV